MNSGSWVALLRLALLVALLVVAWTWWQREREPDHRVDRLVELEPEPSSYVWRRFGTVLGDDVRLAWELGVGQVMLFRTTVPGESPELRLSEGYLHGRPELVVSLVAPGRRREEVARFEGTEEAFTDHRFPIDAEPGDEVLIELRVGDGRGNPGLGRLYVADVMLASAGRAVDETSIPIRLESVVADLMPADERIVVRAPRTPIHDRWELPGPRCARIPPGGELVLELARVPERATLHLVVHADGRLAGDDRLTLAVDGEPLVHVPLAYAIGGPRQGLAEVDFGAWAGRAVQLRLTTTAGEDAFVGLREALMTAPREGARRPFDPERSRNLLLVVVDSLRADALGCYGNPRAHTPHLDALAARGGRYESVWSPSSWTRPAVGSLFTGTSPFTHGLGMAEDRVLSPRQLTLAEVAAWAGKSTACFSSSAFVAPGSGLEQGFEHVEFHLAPARYLVRRALFWLEDARQFEWFVVLHLNDPAYPYTPAALDRAAASAEPDPALVERLRALDSRPGAAERTAWESRGLYDAEVAGVDRAIGQILDGLREMDLLENTSVVLVADHGEEFYEHGGRLHGQSLFDEVLRVPLIVAGPGVRAPFVETTPIELVDVARLVLALGGLAPSETFQGELPAPFGARHPAAPVSHAVLRPIEGFSRHALDATRSGPWLRVYDRGADVERLYRLDRDPLATHDLLAVAAARATVDDDEGDVAAAAAAADAALQARALEIAFADWARRSLLEATAHAVPIEVERVGR